MLATAVAAVLAGARSLCATAQWAREPTYITIIGDDLRRVPRLMSLARATVSAIRCDLAWAFGYSAVMLSTVSLGVLHALLAASLMPFISLAVVGTLLPLAAGTKETGELP